MNAGALLLLAGAGLLFARRADAGGFDDTWTGGTVTYSSSIRRMAEAIAYAEGFYAAGTPIPKRLNNPGDLKRSSVPNVGTDAAGHLEFATIADGWEALHRQLQLIVDGRSRVYTLDMTIAQMAAKYAEGSTQWAANVSRRLGVGDSTTLRAVLL